MRPEWFPKIFIVPLALVVSLLRTAADPAPLPDKTFQLPVDFQGYARALVQDSHGNMIALGEFQCPSWQGPSMVALFNPDGTVRSDFDASATRGYGWGVVAATSPDCIYLLGFFVGDDPAAAPFLQVRKLDYNGTEDPDFRATIRSSNGRPKGILASHAGVILFGEFSAVKETPVTNLARLLPDGALDISFSAKLNGVPTAGLIQPDGKIVLAGNFGAYAGQSRLVRLNSDGSEDTSFANADVLDGDVWCLVLQPDQKILAGGTFRHYGAETRGRIARFLPDGTLDAGFNPGTGADEPINSILVRENGDVVLAGSFNRFGTHATHRLARLHPDGALDAAFNAGKGPNESIFSIVGAPGPKQAFVSGSFNSIDDFEQRSPARINLDPPDRPFIGFPQSRFFVNEGDGEATVLLKRYGDQNGTSVVHLETAEGTASAGLDYIAASADVVFGPGEAQKEVRISIVQDGLVELKEFFIVNLSARENCFGTDTARVEITDDEIPVVMDDDLQVAVAHDPRLAPVLQSSGKIIVAAFENPDSEEGENFYRLERNGALDPIFKSAFRSSRAISLVVQPDDKLLVSGMTGNLQPTGRLVRLLPDGQMDPAFHPLGEPIASLQLTADGKIYISPPFRRLNPDGTLDETFRPTDTNSSPAAVQADGKAIIVDTSYIWDGRTPIYRLNLDGSIDPTFRSSAAVQVRDVILQPDGKLVVLGGNASGFFPVQSLTRLNPDGSPDSSFKPDLGLLINPPHISAIAVSYGHSLAIDYEGNIWLQQPYHNSLLKLTPGGQVSDSFIFRNANLSYLASLVPERNGTLLATEGGNRGLKRIYGSNKDLTKITFAPEASAVVESNRSVTITASRIGLTQDALDLPLVVQSKIGAPPVQLSEQRIALPSLQVTANFTLQIQDDDLVNWDEELQIGVDPSQVGHPIVQRPAVLRIIDNDGRPWNTDATLHGPARFLYGLSGVAQVSPGGFLVWGSSSGGAAASGSLDADGREIGSFLRGTTQGGEVLWAQVLPSRRILAAFATESSPIPLAFAPNGFYDDSFSFPFTPEYSRIIQEQSDGKLVVGGWLLLPEFQYGYGVVRLQPNGAFDRSFQNIDLDREANGQTSIAISSMLVQPDDRILLGGDFGVRRFLKDGSVDASFKKPAIGSISMLAVDSQGNILATHNPYGSSVGAAVFQLKPDGTLDRKIPAISDVFNWVACVAPDKNGSLWIGGYSKEFRGAELLRVLPSGELDRSFTATNSFTLGSRPGGVSTVLPQENGDLVVAGIFTEFNGLPVNGLVRLKGEPPLQLRLIASSETREHELRIASKPGTFICLEYSPDLRNWSPFVTNQATCFEWRLPIPKGSASFFFRAWQQ